MSVWGPGRLNCVRCVSWNPQSYFRPKYMTVHTLSVSFLNQNLIPYLGPLILVHFSKTWPQLKEMAFISENICRGFQISQFYGKITLILTTWTAKIVNTHYIQNVQTQYPISDQNGSKSIPFGAAHTYIAYLSPPTMRLNCYLLLVSWVVWKRADLCFEKFVRIF